MGYRRLIKLFLFTLTASLLLSFPAAANADAPADALTKGSVPARSTELDRSAYFDASGHENPAPDVEIVKIGLRYGDNSVSYAGFYNKSGRGFSIGWYDDNRLFHAQTHTDAAWLETYRTEDKIVLAGWAYYEEFEAKDGIALLPDGGGPTLFRDNSYLGGLRLTAWDNNTLIVTNFVELEEYVYNQNKYEEYDFDLTGDTESQVSRGVTYATDLTDRAVDSTKGQYVRYQGEICEIYYFASDGGETEDGKNVFGSERPYLAGKTDPFEDAVDYTGRSWTAYRDGWELWNRLQINEVEIGLVTDFEPRYSELGNVIGVTYTDEAGARVTLDGRDSYAFVGLSNCRFQVQKEEDVFIFTGSGWGHNCGMSQWGARAMAEVYGYNCEDIIRFYYTGAYVG